MRTIRLLLLWMALSTSGTAMSQQLSNNYVRCLFHTDDSTVIERVEYFDGLGRRSQRVLKGCSPGGNDLVTLAGHDCFGRDSLVWLPAVLADVDSMLPSQAVRDASVSSNGDVSPYTRTTYEPSPLGRPSSVTGPGQAWHAAGKAVTTEYLFNAAADRHCTRYAMAGDGVSFKVDGSYAPGELDVVCTTDEDGNIGCRFTDLHGRLLLARDQDATGALVRDTYFVYDLRGNLRYVVPPMAVPSLTAAGMTWNSGDDVVDAYCYCYQYNSRNQCVSRKLPGCEPVLQRYDKSGRMVASQDGNQREDGRWLVCLYDQYGRETVRLLASGLPAGLDSMVVKTEPAPGQWGFTANVNFPDADILSVNYYDGYDFLDNFAAVKDSLAYRPMGSSGYSPRWTGGGAGSARGLLTGTAVRVLGDTAVLVGAVYYDVHGNVVQTHAANHLGGFDHEYSRLTYTGKPLAVRREHSTSTKPQTVETYAHTYDAMERPLTTAVTHGGATTLLASNTYDALGRLAGTATANANTSATYAYNVRGWTTEVRNVHLLQQLFYEVLPDGGGPGCWNGNVGAMRWASLEGMHAAGGIQQQYDYRYDGLGRLTAAGYSTTAQSGSWNGGVVSMTDRNASCHYDYDLNSNLTSIRRKGVDDRWGDSSGWDVRYWGQIDSLTLTYDGNRLRKVSDQADDPTYAGAMDFVDGANRAVEYEWDSNGNMTRDRNKKIYEIRYNVLNLPERIQYNDGHVVRYTYAADGRKLRVQYLLSPVVILDDDEGGGGEPAPGPGLGPLSFPGAQLMGGGMAGGGTPGGGVPGGGVVPQETVQMTRDYVGSHVYRNDSLERVLEPTGYFGATGTFFAYVRDYQGNVRVVVSPTGDVAEVNHYYPYGMLMTPEAGVQPHKYGGKELDRQNGLDWYDSQARWYDPALGRTTTMDPKAEYYPAVSPYAWCAGNPVRFTDPTGMDAILSGCGTKNNPFVISANYYYDGELPDVAKKSLETAVNDYNRDGKIWEIGKGSDKQYVQFDLRAMEASDNAVQEAREDFALASDGRHLNKGNYVSTIKNQSDNSEWGEADYQSVSVNVDGITSEYEGNKSMISSAITSAFTHEIGHNLGLEHSDYTSIMRERPTTVGLGINNTIMSPFILWPKVDANGVKTLIKRVDQQSVNGGGVIRRTY